MYQQVAPIEIYVNFSFAVNKQPYLKKKKKKSQ